MDMPSIIRTSQGDIRRVGVELEFVGIDLLSAAEAVRDVCGGVINRRSDYEVAVDCSSYGSFRVEYDSNYLKQVQKGASFESDGIVSRLFGNKPEVLLSMDRDEQIEPGIIEKLLRSLASLEVVSPPIKITELYTLNQLIAGLHRRGAKGTRNQPLRALGLHFNPEVVSKDVSNILPVLKAFLCLYDRLLVLESVDIVRKIYPYIQPFPLDYVKLVINPRYNPPLDIVIMDYLEFNPTRNRPLDLLPLFMTILPDLVQRKVDSSLVSSRPTFHYRLPNSEVDDPAWSLTGAWNNWVMVEKLAYDAPLLDELCRAYSDHLERTQQLSSAGWIHTLDALVTPSGAISNFLPIGS